MLDNYYPLPLSENYFFGMLTPTAFPVWRLERRFQDQIDLVGCWHLQLLHCHLVSLHGTDASHDVSVAR